jgi:hypothetical protein
MFKCIEDDEIIYMQRPQQKVQIEILEDDIPMVVAKKVKCNIPGCKNLGRQKYNFCIKHSAQYKFEKPDECCVCLEDLKDEKYPLRDCGHWIHHKCVIMTGKEECPCCRAKVTLNKEQQGALNAIKNKNKKEKIEEEQREIRREMELERSLVSRRTSWIDNRESTDFFRGGNRTRDRIQRYLESDERVATVTHLQDLMISQDEETRNDATVLFEMQNMLTRLNNTELRVSRRMMTIFMGITGVVEGEIRGIVTDEILG